MKRTKKLKTKVRRGQLTVPELDTNPKVLSYAIDLKVRYRVRMGCGHHVESPVVSHDGDDPLGSYRAFLKGGLPKLDSHYAKHLCVECDRPKRLEDEATRQLRRINSLIAEARWQKRELYRKTKAAIEAMNQFSRKRNRKGGP